MAATGDRHGRIVAEPRTALASASVADAVVEGVRAGFGALSLGVGVALRILGESPDRVPRQPGPRMPVSELADTLVGTAWGVARLSGRLAATGTRVTAPLLGLVMRPPLVPGRLQPAYGLRLTAERWQRDRPEALRTLGRWSAIALPGAMDAAVEQVDVEQVATVVLDRVDLTRIVSSVLERVDVDEVAAQLLSQLHTDEVVAELLDQLDLTQLVLDRVDLRRVVAGVLERLDLTAIVVEQVDLGGVVDAALQHVDLTQIVMGQVDLVGVAQYVVDGIDLPEIIRDSTGSVASEAVVGLRMQGVDADVAVGRVVDRLLHRHRASPPPGERRTEEVPEQRSPPDQRGDPSAGTPG